jgi:hypothetical protein
LKNIRCARHCGRHRAIGPNVLRHVAALIPQIRWRDHEPSTAQWSGISFTARVLRRGQAAHITVNLPTRLHRM